MADQQMSAETLRPVVAIDGPAGSGKSSTARAVAARLGFAHLDTGAWYRVLTWIGLRDGVDPADAQVLNSALAHFDQVVASSFGADRITVGGVDVTEAIRTPEVSQSVSRYSSVPAVRDHLNHAFRHLAATTSAPGLVVEGRDITTVTFPDAAVRILLTASVDARARRRAAQLGSDDVAGIAQRISERDARDLTVVDFANAADGVTLLDTSDLTLDEVTETVADLVAASTTKEHHE
ncbi:(d)CMP kinase [Pseudoclavibacter soli]|uniref:(d)CMP kinase n=1 Tax=Pseudoclavibacter soli TaxID=452623 RepID=UPI000401C8F2|nr:(d)CMP kinase [Pseudoclavibacter soli]